HEQAAVSRAKQSVTEIKRRMELADEYSGHAITQKFTPALSKRPQFLQEKTTLSAAEKGTAMHALMQHIPLTKAWTVHELDVFVERLVTKELLTKEEGDSLDLQVIEQFFKSPLGELMLTSEQVQREVPFAYRIAAKDIYTDWHEDDEYVLVQGVIDCLIFDEDEITIIDYKTDQITEDVSDALKEKLKKRYEIQVELYKEAVEAIVGKQGKETNLYFFAKYLTITL